MSRGYYFNVKTGQTLWYMMEVIAATVAGPIEEYSEMKVLENDCEINTEIKLE